MAQSKRKGTDDNAVLFSMSNLEAAQPKSKSKGGQASRDKSGLIDLETLTALGSGTVSAQPDASPSGGASAPQEVPLLFNVDAKKSHKLPIIILTLLLFALGGAAYYMWHLKEVEAQKKAEIARKAEEEKQKEIERLKKEKEQEIERLKKEKEEAQKKAELEKQKLAESLALQKAQQKKEMAANEANQEEDDAQKDKKSHRSSSKSKKDNAKTSSKAKEKEKPKDAASVVDKYSGGSSKGLSKDKVKKTIMAYRSAIGRCRKQGGSMKVRYTINPNGKVSKVSISGDLKGTPTGNCVANVFKMMVFPKFDGSPQKESFPIKF